MRPRSKTNSHKFRDLKLQAEYKLANDHCELTLWFRRNYPSLRITDERLDLHHICGGPGRKDYHSNLIRVCRSIHDWVEVRPVEMKLICLWTKWRKSELDWNEINKCSVGRMQGWIDRHPPALAEFVAVWEELREIP